MSVLDRLMVGITICGILGGAVRHLHAAKIETKELGEWPTDPAATTLSADGRHVAVVVKRDSKMVVNVDGKPGTPYDKIETQTPDYRIGPKEVPRIAAKVVSENSPVFSPDAKRIAFVARDADKGAFVVTDGKPGPGFADVEFLEFSANSEHIVYIAVVGKERQHAVVVDDKAGAPFDAIKEVAVSDDGKRVGYVGKKGKGFTVVIDGRLGPECSGVDGSVQFSPDSRHVLYRAQYPGARGSLVVDGKLGPDAHSWQYSPDGRRFACVIQKMQPFSNILVVDGKQITSTDTIGEITFSPDSKHFGYITEKKNYYAAVIDAMEVAVNGQFAYGICFSPNSKRVAWIETVPHAAHVTLDGKAGSLYENPSAGLPFYVAFSPDSAHCTYVAVKDKTQRVVFDGKEGAAYAQVSVPQFSKDSKHWGYWARRGGDWILVIDGAESGTYDRMGNLNPPSVTFDDTGTLEFVAAKQGKLYRGRWSE